MNKAPAFQFYVADYLQDTRCLSLAAKGAWTDCLCAMWRSQTKGTITFPLIGFARLFGCTVEQAETVINELVEMQICDRVTHGDGKMALTNRRMQREEKEREAVKNRVRKFRKNKAVTNGNGNVTDAETTMNVEENGKAQNGSENVTPYSSSTSTNTTLSSSNEKERGGKPPPSAETSKLDIQGGESGQSYLERKQTEFPQKPVLEIYRKFVGLCGSTKYPHLRNTRRQFDKWLENEDDTLDILLEPEEFTVPGIGKLK